jgi:hypothetical protein
MPGVPERRTCSYVRHGTTTLFAHSMSPRGLSSVNANKGHQTIAFLKFLEEIEDQAPEGLDIHIVMDNYPAHVLPEAATALVGIEACAASHHRSREMQALGHNVH